jgi:hypothetical protein
MASLFRRSYTKPDATGQRVTRKVRKWYGKYRDADNNLQCVPLNELKSAAMVMLADLIRKANLRRAGLFDPAADYLDRPIDEHVTDFRTSLEAKGRSRKHLPRQSG